MGSGAKAKKISRKLLIKEIFLRILAKKIILPKEEKNGLRPHMYIACSKRSDSGEQCEVKKAMKSRGGLGREVRFYFFALLFTLHRSPLFERLEQANMYNKILASLKIPTTPPPPPPPPPNHFSNGPSFNENLGQNELVICNLVLTGR